MNPIVLCASLIGVAASPPPVDRATHEGSVAHIRSRSGEARAEEKLVRLGMMGLGTTHVIAFTEYINDPKNNTRCRGVAGHPGGSPDFPASANRVGAFTRGLRSSPRGSRSSSTSPWPKIWPMSSRYSRLAREHGVPCWSSSALRYGEGIAGVRDNEALGKVVSCDVFGSSSWTEHHLDLYLEGIHAFEALFAVMGTGCRSVRRIKTDATDMVVGVWRDGRIGTFRDARGIKGYGTAYIYGTQGTATGKSAG